nr:hypothetical protein [Tanacetum cinerariifolium]
FFIIAVQTPGSGISILLAVGTPSTGSGNLYCQWELSPGSGNALAGENLDKMKEKDHVSSDPVPECQRMTLEHDNLSPDTQCQDNVTQTYKTKTTSNELDLLFSPMFDELLNGSSKVVSKSFVVTTADAPNQRQQQTTTPLNTLSTPDLTCQVPPHAPTVASNENMNQMTSLSTSFVLRYKTKGRRRHVMLIRQICIYSINITLLSIVGRKIIR